MRKFLLSTICLLLSVAASYGQVTVYYASGTTTTVSGSNITYTGGGSFTNDGTFVMTTSPDVMNIDGGSGFTFAGAGTTDLYNLHIINNGVATFTSSVTVHGTVTVDAGASLDAGGKLVLAPGANLVVNGLIANNSIGLVTAATVTTGGCPSYTSVLSTNISGSVIKYQWESSPNNTTYNSISGATNATYTATINPTADQYYHVVITTTNNAYTQTTPNTQLNFTGAVPASISGTAIVCQGLTTALTDATTGGVWSSSTTTVATVNSSGLVTGTGGGTATITYSTGCLPNATQVVTVNPIPSVIGGTQSVCVGLNTTLTDATAFGAWSSLNSSVATVGSSTGIVTGAAAGTATISYALTTGCASTVVFTVYPLPAAISGNVPVCASGGSTTLSDATTGGAWTSSTSSVATVNSSTGLVTGGSAGTSTITYTSATGCVATTVFTVTALPTVSGGSNVAICNGNNTTLTASGASVYTWSPSTGLSATTGTSVTANPTSTITYTVTGSNTSSITYSQSFTGGASPSTGAASAWTTLCSSLTGSYTGFTFSSSASGTVYNCTSPSVATLIANALNTGTNATQTSDGHTWYVLAPGSCGAGSIFGVDMSPCACATPASLRPQIGNPAWGGFGGTCAPGSQTITFSFGSGGSCSNTAIVTVTVNPKPTAITGTATVCNGLTTTLSDATSSGAWSSAATTVATVSGGLVTGASVGTTTISYTLPTSCYTTTVVTVNTQPVAISGTSTVCVGSTTGLSDATAGGAWSSNNTSIASINSSGVVTGNTAGTATVSYTLPAGCFVTQVITVNPVPAAITGTPTVCNGLTTTLSDATSFGAWSSSATTVATVSGGVVTGSSVGTATISYTLATTCTATQVVTVNPQPVAVSGTTSVCVGFTTGLSDATGGGAWTSNNTSIATINSSGVVNGVAAGTATVSYTLPAGCFSTTVITVNPVPTNILGNVAICNGGSITLSDATGFGQWYSSNTSVATVTLTTGVLTSSSVGTTTITYLLGTGCYTTVTGTVNTLPSSISGANNVCIGLTTTLSDAGGGAWSTSNSSIAAVNSSGVVTGNNVGGATITYTLPTGCFTTLPFTVNSLPTGIIGTAAVCPGTSTTLSDATTGGTWSSSNTSFATINSSGVMTGVSAGNPTISYTISATGCYATVLGTVNPTPAAISGTPAVCVGLTTGLSDVNTGGAWASSTTSVATVNSSGLVSGVVAGTSTITYTLPTGCQNTIVVTVNPLPAAITGTPVVCPGTTAALSDATLSGTWSSSNTSLATINSSGVMTGVSAGNPTISYTISATGCYATTLGTVNPLPAAISGTAAVCVGLTTGLSDATTGGAWSSSNTSVATIISSGVATGVVAGTSTITYTLPTGCINTTVLTVNPLPAAIGGNNNVCVSSSTTLSDATAFGAWSSSTTTVATVGSSTGTVTGVAAGTTTITYVLPTGCIATKSFTVNALPAAISANNAVCVGLSNTLSDATTGGNWTSGNTSLATINSSTGLMTGISAGNPAITYTTPSGCIAVATGTVNPLPSAITGTMGACIGLTSPLSDATPSGNWSSGTTAVATINSSGLVNAVTAGTSTITYTLATSCIATSVFTVYPLPTAIGGTNNVCAGSTTTLSDATAFGGWSISNTAVATIGNTTGVVTGVAQGTATVTYTLATGCTTTFSFTVNPLPASISGSAVACVGLTATLSDATTGGAWSSSNTSLATINSSGVMTGLSAGNPTITYTTASGCIATTLGTVNPNPANITGTMNVCVGLNTTLSDATSGGNWSSSNTSVATVASNVVTGVSAGTSTITYLLPTGCQTVATVTVNPLPAAITGTGSVCAGLTTTLSDASTGGSWASSNLGVATIGTANGIVSGIAAGTSTITYTLPTGCTILSSVTVNPLPANITGTMNVCAGLTTPLNTTTGGGNWSSSNTSVATINGSGVVTGVVAGTSTITYLLPTGCQTLATVTVNPLPANITGTLIVCSAATTTLADVTPAGAWTSSATAVATVNSGTGVVSGVSPGTSAVTYTLSTGCLTSTVVTVNPTPAAITASTVFNVCVGSAIGLNDPSGFGNWSSSNTALATIGTGTGIVTGVAAGTPTMTYSFANGCFATAGVTVNPLPASITGTFSACIGATSGLANTTPSGTWSSGATTIATVNSSTGVVTGVATGTATISYILPTGCMSTSIFTVNPFPLSITGTMSVCPGNTTALADPSVGGNWSSSNTAVATVGSGNGIVTGVAAGTATVTYTLSTGCSSSTVVTVNPLPSNITGITNVCAGLTTALSDAGGGTWTSSNTTAATVGFTSGIVSGINAGTTTITYTLPGTGCQATAAVTVNPLPASITGTMSVCAGLTTPLANTSAGGGWTSSNTSVATINGSGVVTGVVAGTATVTYTLPTGCISTAVVTVNPLPAGITGTTNVCIGLTTGLADATLFGAWSSSTTAVATVGASSGVVTGVSAGTTLITYMLSTGCITTTQVTVNPLPVAITGITNVCAGLTTTLSDASTGGTWTSGNTTAATVTSGSGIVTGLSAGTSAITYTLPTGCQTITAVTVNPLPAGITGTTNVCAGLTTTLSNATPSGSWTSSAPTIAAIGTTSGIITGVAAGTATITYMLPTGCIATTAVTVNPLPATITGTMAVCAGLTTTLSDASAGGNWTSSNTSVATVAGNVVTGVVAGTSTITYTLATGCIITSVVTVNPLPAAISGTTSVCVAATTSLSDATPFGAWSVSNSSIATVNSATGVVTGVLAGTATATYTLPTGCISTTLITVNPLPAAITGTPTVCPGLTTTLSDATSSGNWTSSNTTAATINSTGVVSGLNAGTSTITYTLPATGCTITRTVTVNPLPVNISGTMAVCVGLTTGLSDATSAGTWTSVNTSVATINNGTGLVTGVSAGTSTISYALTASGCAITAVVTVNPLPASITGTAQVCVGLTTSLSDAGGGTWASSNLSVASVGTSSGIVTGILAGTSTVTYTLSTGCIITTAVTVNPLPANITGTMAVCAGLTTTLTDATTGGTWSSGNTSVATTSGNIVTGVVAGTATITYTLPTGCINTAVVTVNPLPSSILGSNNVCIGLTTILSDATPFGAWSSSNTTVATINSGTGLLTGNTVGTATVTYTISTGCITTMGFTVNPLPVAITGTAVVCAGLTTTLSDASLGGNWTSSNTSVATIISGTGVMTGLVAGTTTITYTLPTGCTITRTATVNPLPAGITGTTNVCAGLTTTLSDATTLGSWSSSNTTVATIGNTTGIVNGLVAGTTTITYTLSATGCIMTTPVTVNPLPAAITGTAVVCAGLTTTLSDATALGSWSSGNTSVATIVSGTGVMTGVAAGTTTITYTLPTGCIMTINATVNPLPAGITGTTNVCAGLTTTLSDATTLGSWSSSNTTVATIGNTTGVVNGLVAGTTTITYTLSATGCIMTTPVTVNPLPATITGTAVACVGLTATLSDATLGGTWSSSNTSMATIVSSTGVMTGVSAGNPVITYTLPTGCIMTRTATVNPLPASITGTMQVCAGLTTTMSDATPFGSWSSSNTTVATVGNSNGIVNGLVAGTTTITYTLPTGCINTTIVKVNPLPQTIGGTLQVCAGLTTALSDASAGGTWSNDLTPLITVATINSATGVVTGLTAGTNVITYTLSTGCLITGVVTVNPLPAAITGTTQVCVGLTTTLSDINPGGTWSTAYPAIAIASGNVITGVAAGATIVTYTLGTGCITTKIVTVNPLPAAITGNMHVCAGLTTTLSDASAGGVWSSNNTTIVTIGSASGIATGITTPAATITYTLPTGCIITTIVNVDPLPSAITGTMQVCAGLTTPLGNTSLGGSWTSGNTAVATIDNTTGVVTGVMAGTTTVTYTLPTGCINTAVVMVNPLPATITGTMQVCVGNTTTLTDAGGGMWNSSNTAVATISGSTVTGVMGGTTTITYTLPTGCITTTSVLVDTLPAVYVVTGGGPYCTYGSGVHILLNGSNSGVNYQLYNGSTPIGSSPVSGTGSPLDFGLFTATGTYTVTATNPTTHCANNMTSSATITLLPLPTVYTVSGGGSYCAGDTGVHVGMGTTETGVKYQLYKGGVALGTAKPGTGGPLDFGLFTVADTYTVEAINITTTCNDMMSGKATVSINPLLTPGVSIYYGNPADTICAGTPVTFTATPVNGGTAPAYEWQVNGVNKGVTDVFTYVPVLGDVVKVVLTSNAICPVPDTAAAAVIMPIVPLSLPVVSIVSDHTDTICNGTAVTYTATESFGGTMPILTWVKNGIVVGAGATYTYTPVDSDIIYSSLVSNYRCRSVNRVFSNNIRMSVDEAIIPIVSILADPGNTVAAGTPVTLTAQVTSGGNMPKYTWYLNQAAITGATNATYANTFANHDSVTVQVQRTDACGMSSFNGLLMHVVGGVNVKTIAGGNGSVSVLPNPNKGEFDVKGTLGVTTDEIVTLEMTNMLGQIVHKSEALAKGGNVDAHIKVTNTLANGMYLLTVHSDAGSKVFHIVIEQ